MSARHLQSRRGSVLLTLPCWTVWGCSGHDPAQLQVGLLAGLRKGCFAEKQIGLIVSLWSV
jgi:hypothetical protein